MKGSGLNIISLGAGVQSSTMALMAAAGEITPLPVAAVFADTQGEPAAVYRWLDWLARQLPFPVIRATRGSLAGASVRLRRSRKSGNTYLSPSLPVFTVGGDKGGMLRRQCTRDFKIDVVRRACRQLMRERSAAITVQWIGISTDEAHRMKDSNNRRFANVYPLIDAGVSRDGCLAWMKRKGYPEPPRSACVYCPYHSDAEWLRLKHEDPPSFLAAVEYERTLSAAVAAATALKVDAAFLHESRVPLDRVIFRPRAKQPSLFGNECEGMCGT